ncbi:hypothetical protein [Rhodococcus rhodochrous]|uniref:hypothetical protein n=1 Tax=Rhodococcus rhodochrous TaxID=1829 RepID=UPI001786963D|nr:hypothetical protein [Rhodococcus rhodochrous]QOH59871.1 hypothetical protein C6Y44_27665 [Rhodococcus rhodochrous]
MSNLDERTIYHCYATNSVDYSGALPGIDVTDEYGEPVCSTHRPPGWAGGGGFDPPLLDAELELLGFRRLGPWEVGIAHAHTLAKAATDL